MCITRMISSFGVFVSVKVQSGRSDGPPNHVNVGSSSSSSSMSHRPLAGLLIVMFNVFKTNAPPHA